MNHFQMNEVFLRLLLNEFGGNHGIGQLITQFDFDGAFNVVRINAFYVHKRNGTLRSLVSNIEP